MTGDATIGRETSPSQASRQMEHITVEDFAIGDEVIINDKHGFGHRAFIVKVFSNGEYLDERVGVDYRDGLTKFEVMRAFDMKPAPPQPPPSQRPAPPPAKEIMFG